MSRYLFFGLITCVLASQAASREIPLSEIFSTGGQKGLQRVPPDTQIVDGKVAGKVSATIELERRHDGSSNAFLVDAPKIGDAVNATARVLTGFRAADTPVPPLSILTGINWLVVYLGSGHSNPTKWIVESVTVDGNKIRLTYRKPKVVGPQTLDGRPYYFWVKLDALDAAAYNLELYDSELKAVTLMRRVEVKSQ
jgi:hypothetical protein